MLLYLFDIYSLWFRYLSVSRNEEITKGQHDVNHTM